MRVTGQTGLGEAWAHSEVRGQGQDYNGILRQETSQGQLSYTAQESPSDTEVGRKIEPGKARWILLPELASGLMGGRRKIRKADGLKLDPQSPHQDKTNGRCSPSAGISAQFPNWWTRSPPCPRLRKQH